MEICWLCQPKSCTKTCGQVLKERNDKMFYERNRSLLVAYFQSGCKRNNEQKIGVEIEHFIVKKETKESVSYYGAGGVGEILKKLKSKFPHISCEQGHMIGLWNEQYAITLEPASQFEISIFPQDCLEDVEKIYTAFLEMMKPILDAYGYEMWTGGYQPYNKVDELPLIPKKRYQYMDEYFKTSGTTGRNMMRGTASTQVSIDYFDEKDFVRKMRAAYILMPAIKLLTDNTQVFEGRIYEKHMARTMIWHHVDDQRCGIVPGLFDEDFGFEKYADYLMQLPLIFLPNKGEPLYVKRQHAKEIWKEKELNKEDIEHILSMTFVDVRLKKYLEIRGADSMPFAYVKAYTVMINSILFNERAVDEILSWNVHEQEIRKAEEELIEKGFSGTVYGQPVDIHLRRIKQMAKENLSDKERNWLQPLEQIIDEKRTLAKRYEK